MTKNLRWEGDERGHGVAGAEWLHPKIDALRGAMSRPDWVAEEPEAHLLPHLLRWCNSPESQLRLLSSSTEHDAVLAVELEATSGSNYRQLRQALFGLIGSVAESATYVHERAHAGRVEFVVVTGMLDEQTEFNSHGHVVRISVETRP